MAVNPSIAFLSGLSDIKIWGSSGNEHAERMLRRVGFEDIVFAGDAMAFESDVFFLRADAVVDESILRTILNEPDTILLAPSQGGFAALAANATQEKISVASQLMSDRGTSLPEVRESGLKPLLAEDFGAAYNNALRKRSAPLAVLLTAENTAQVHWQMFEASYKGVTDIVTKYVWPRVAFPITRALASAKVTPNQVTTCGFLLSLLTLFLFYEGRFAEGLLSAWIMALLDTVDGKLARVTLTSSKWGNVFDHGIDLVAPPLWWFAWWYGLGDHSGQWIAWSVWLVLGGHIAGKLIEQAFISTFGLKVHIWRKLDSSFRLITARRNPNLIILTAAMLFGAPAVGYLAMAAWIIICFDFHSVRYVQALVLRKNGTQIRSWLQE